jgi:tetratricopeptide (TPR) repeat protein
MHIKQAPYPLRIKYLKPAISMKDQNLQKRLTTKFLIVFIGIFFFLFYTHPCVAQSKKTAETYKTMVKQADEAFAAKDYKGALLLYEKAHQAKPDYNYATDKIDEITKILNAGADSKTPSAQSKKSGSTYKTLIAQADYALDAKEYADALLLYEKAYQTRPDYNYATEKIDKINSMLNATPETKSLLLKNTLHKADSLYEQKNYPLAKTEYQKASLIDTTAQLPKDKLKQISSYYVDPDGMANFNLAIANGDQELAESDFDHAILFYQAALELHPNSKFVTKKITDAKKQQEDYKAQTGKPVINIASAEKQLQSEKSPKTTVEKEKVLAVAIDNQNGQDKIKETDKNTNVSKESIIKDKTIEKGVSQQQLNQQNYDAALASAEKLLKSAEYEAALASFKSALVIKPGEKYPSQKIDEITAIIEKQKESNENYSNLLAEADNKFNGKRFEEAISSYTKALELKPAETYPQQKIADAQSKLAASKSKDNEYSSSIAIGDRLLSESKYNEALNAFKQALSIKPDEAYPLAKTAEINSILSKQKSDSESYAQALRTGDKALAAGDYSLALTSYQDARKIKPSEQYPQVQIAEINAKLAFQLKKDEKYTTVINTGDKLFADKDYNNALTAYTEASELKKNEKYPQDQIAKINILLTDSHSVDVNYTSAITEGDKLLKIKDYAEAKSAFVKATGLKPAEIYPKQRIIEINKIIDEIALANSADYNKALDVANKLYNKKIFDQAIDAYEAAAKINPGDAYPELQIGKIRKYMSDHAILDLNSQALIINKGNEKKFAFSAIDPSLRKNNYILLKARSTGNTAPKVYLNYGKDETKNGGIVLRNLDKTTLRDFLISISIQDKWFREENNWISIAVETGAIEITKVQIAAGE